MSRYRCKGDGYLSNVSQVYGRRYQQSLRTGLITTFDLSWAPAINTRFPNIIERCTDEIHRIRHNGFQKGYVDGGPFDKWTIRDGGLKPQMYSVSYMHPDAPVLKTYRYWASGTVICTVRPKDLDPLMYPTSGTPTHLASSPSYGDATSYGPTAWSRFKPGKPKVDLGLFLAELRDAPRMLLSSLKWFVNAEKALRRSGVLRGLSKEAAQHHLNTQFGWLPFLNDVRRFYATCVDLDKHIAQIKRDNGQWVRKAGTVEEKDEISTWTTASAAVAPSPGSVFFHQVGAGSTTFVKEQYSNVWFAGRFRYWIPDIQSGKTEARVLRKLYGLDVTPSLVWNLIPFSWLGDWVSNVGDNISNLTNGWAENLTAKYAYVMRTTGTAVSVTPKWHTRQCGTIPFHFRYYLTRKVRVGASPFGFDLDFGDFSQRQLSILSALGLSRLKSW